MHRCAGMYIKHWIVVYGHLDMHNVSWSPKKLVSPMLPSPDVRRGSLHLRERLVAALLSHALFWFGCWLTASTSRITTYYPALKGVRRIPPPKPTKATYSSRPAHHPIPTEEPGNLGRSKFSALILPANGL